MHGLLDETTLIQTCIFESELGMAKKWENVAMAGGGPKVYEKSGLDAFGNVRYLNRVAKSGGGKAGIWASREPFRAAFY